MSQQQLYYMQMPTHNHQLPPALSQNDLMVNQGNTNMNSSGSSGTATSVNQIHGNIPSFGNICQSTSIASIPPYNRSSSTGAYCGNGLNMHTQHHMSIQQPHLGSSIAMMNSMTSNSSNPSYIHSGNPLSMSMSMSGVWAGM